ncbi:class II fructose-bisphosphate aldolase [Pseudolysinimonas kribbensis]|uniref:Fructose-bisphosphate aldolase n=1 Tax=Pseudolysinimonas kribbensis TaxID=433641 RepID=A0ABQ6K4L4_9MICO|nr:class II fructose-bisphosphate aldolase [Pseudolysinimonas kribbensis]GMA94490.1 fructose-bisphosphate aldolase [Pseudolysinimonas kribbensis]
MTLARTADLVADAVARGVAVPSFNVITLEHAEAIVAGARAAGVDVLLQLSQNAVRYHGSLAPIASACRALAENAGVRVAIHLDHIDDVALAEQVIADGPRLGISSIMVDASTLPYADNVALTRDLGARAGAAGLWVEAELGEVGGKDGAHAPGVRTDPAEAAAFAAATGIDGLAVAVGSSHAMTARTADLDLDLVGRLAGAVAAPLVLHGSSGVPDATIAAAVGAGIRKVNIGTALNVAFTGAVRETLAADAALTDPRKYLRPARDAMTDAVADLCRVVGG